MQCNCAITFEGRTKPKTPAKSSVNFKLERNIMIALYTSYCIITARKRSLRRLCFYTCLSVILFTGGEGVCLSASWDSRPPQDQTPLGADTPREQKPPGSRHPPGADTPLSPSPRGADPPAQCMLGEWVVRILLECILVSHKLIVFLLRLHEYLLKFR